MTDFATFVATTIDPNRLTTKPQVFNGSVAARALTRVAGFLQPLAAVDQADQVDQAGQVNYQITAKLDANGRKLVHCIIEGYVLLAVPGVTGGAKHTFRHESKLVLVREDSELPDLDDEPDDEDTIVATTPMPLHDLIEDEVLLGLPAVPGAGFGSAELSAWSGSPAVQAAAAAIEIRPNPFAALKDLGKK